MRVLGKLRLNPTQPQIRLWDTSDLESRNAADDHVFARSEPGTIASLLLPESKEALAGILKYHVVPGKVQVNDANVIQTDIECSNGVIHVIDSVILPN